MEKINLFGEKKSSNCVKTQGDLLEFYHSQFQKIAHELDGLNRFKLKTVTLTPVVDLSSLTLTTEEKIVEFVLWLIMVDDVVFLFHSVNFTKYPIFRYVEFYEAKMEHGDCLFIPYKWYANLDRFYWSFSVISMNYPFCMETSLRFQTPLGGVDFPFLFFLISR